MYVLKKYTANGAMHIFTLSLSLSLSLSHKKRKNMSTEMYCNMEKNINIK
jgi:hypothetical protein